MFCDEGLGDELGEKGWRWSNRLSWRRLAFVSAQKPKRALTFVVRFRRETLTCPTCGNHQHRTCSALSAISCHRSTNSSNPILQHSSSRLNALSHSIPSATITPTLPNPHSALRNRSESCSRLARTTGASGRGRTRSRKVMQDERLPYVTPEPWVAVLRQPARVWSEIEPREEMARDCWRRMGCRAESLIPA
jgi:hypothetical protein